jgi:putative endopeptidase
VVRETDAVQALAQAFLKVPVPTWRSYFRYHYLVRVSEVLPKPFDEETFDFYGRTLNGQKEQRPRKLLGVEAVDAALGEAVGELYVARYFPPSSKELVLQLVENLRASYAERIQHLTWMTPETKKVALEKLAAFHPKIGYPDKWRDYSKLQIIRGDAMGNSLRANSFDFNRRMNKIGKPVDRNEWEMTPPTVNAYYDPLMNDINFPAGILQPPFYANSMDDAVNFGGIGAVIGHELTHGFDDQGGQFDGHGNLHNWWTPQDYKNFQERGQCIADEYSKFTAIDDVHLNGKLTEGENIADNGGVRLALMALLQMTGDKPQQKVDGFTPEQRLFLSWGRIWCQNSRPEESRHLAAVDPHSPGRYRVNGVLRNMPEFGKAFSCKSDSPMVAQNACRVW